MLPRSALSASGSAKWREEVLAAGEFCDVTLLLNNRQWVFADIHPQTTVALTTVRKGVSECPRVRFRGPYRDLTGFREGTDKPPLEAPVEEFLTWSATAAFPLVADEQAMAVFLKMRRHPRLDAEGYGWRARAVQGDLNATTGKRYMLLAPETTAGLWPVYTGASFDLWQPDTGEYYAWVEPDHVCRVLQERRLNQAKVARSAFAELPREVIADPATLPCRQPRIAFRDVTNRTNQRTVIAALVPPRVVCVHLAPYLLWTQGDERDQAYLLAVLCSLPLDWYARRYVETHVTFDILYAFPVPRRKRTEALRRRVEELAGRLAAVDERYAHWAAAVGVPVASVTDPAEKADMVAELDAAVALLYGLEEADLRHIFATFHEGWDDEPRLEATLAHLRRLKERR